jgi:ATP-binding protein involved in chromosome partitioning
VRIAIPLSEGKLCQHFGHCEEFLFVDADPCTQNISGRRVEKAPDHQPGLLPLWLRERAVNVVIAGGIGSHAKYLLAAASVQVLAGITASDPEVIVSTFLNGKLETGITGCDHSGGSCQH